jgi:hypothetical protein
LHAHPSTGPHADFNHSRFRIQSTGTWSSGSAGSSDRHLVAKFGRIVDFDPARSHTPVDAAAAKLEAEQRAAERIIVGVQVLLPTIERSPAPSRLGILRLCTAKSNREHYEMAADARR